MPLWAQWKTSNTVIQLHIYVISKSTKQTYHTNNLSFRQTSQNLLLGQELHKRQGKRLILCIKGNCQWFIVYEGRTVSSLFSAQGNVNSYYHILLIQSTVYECLSQSFLSKLLHLASNNETSDGLYEGHKSIAYFGEQTLELDISYSFRIV